MQTMKLLSAAIAAAAIGLTAPAALAHDHKDGKAYDPNPAAGAGGTEGTRGVGGSVRVPAAGAGPDETSPYTDDDDDYADDDNGSTMRDITSGDRPITDERGRRGE